MKLLTVQQGTQEWFDARLGIPTASQFDRILTPKTMKRSSQARGYMCELIAERMIGRHADGITTDWIERGRALEAEAVAYYEMQRGADTRPGGFAKLDSGIAGCSPDRLVGENGGLEIKCPSPAKHVAYLLGDLVADAYRCQVQGSLWITGRQWWDTLSYHPDMPPALVRVERDDAFIEMLEREVLAFCDELEAGHRELAALVAAA